MRELKLTQSKSRAENAFASKLSEKELCQFIQDGANPQFLKKLGSCIGCDVVIIGTTAAGGRTKRYDMSVSLLNQGGGGNLNIELELKTGALCLTKIPQILNAPYKVGVFPKDYLDFHHRVVLPCIVDYCNSINGNNLTLPVLSEYLKNVKSNQTRSAFLKELKKLYDSNDDFWSVSKVLTNFGINDFIKDNDIDLDIMNNILGCSSVDKVFVLYKDGQYKLTKYPSGTTKLTKVLYKTHNSYICSTQNPNYRMKILLRWKNGSGILYPALQISLHSSTYIPRKKDIIKFYI